MSIFSSLPFYAKDPIYGLQEEYRADPRREKINLSIGVCVDAEARPLKLVSVSTAFEHVVSHKKDFGYLPIDGDSFFNRLLPQALFGNQAAYQELFSVQTIGGTGALFAAAHLLEKSGICEIVIPKPTWINHCPLFEQTSMKLVTPRVYGEGIAFDVLKEAIAHCTPSKSAILFQLSCHNPTGIDCTEDQWRELSRLLREKKVFPLFDAAYLGLGGSFVEDTVPLQLFLAEGHEMLIAVSFAKNCGLYGERPGALVVACHYEWVEQCKGYLKALIRHTYSTPSAIGAQTVAQLLHNTSLRLLWQQELEEIRQALARNRAAFVTELERHNLLFLSPHIAKTRGLFALFSLQSKQIAALKSDAVYIGDDGRINIAGASLETIPFIVEKIAYAMSLG